MFRRPARRHCQVNCPVRIENTYPRSVVERAQKNVCRYGSRLFQLLEWQDEEQASHGVLKIFFGLLAQYFEVTFFAKDIAIEGNVRPVNVLVNVSLSAQSNWKQDFVVPVMDSSRSSFARSAGQEWQSLCGRDCAERRCVYCMHKIQSVLKVARWGLSWSVPSKFEQNISSPLIKIWKNYHHNCIG